MTDQKRHFFTCYGNDYLVLGYSPENNTVLYICMNILHKTDQHDLEFLVNTEEAQNEIYLAAILVRHPYAGGGTWWERLLPHIYFAGIDQVRGLIPSDQIVAFMAELTEYQNKKHINEATVEQTSMVKTPTKENIDDILFGRID